ncbi:hypothetical protein MSPP1_001513 [Malassezia sp. CBS 17886]|nr:hypothetical protein MSPP1_001513 [Malassezia sp. CBS 17886]
MGRKKIKIQPITGDRNRSATYLKRKTGLFKKAYELAVLTDSDIAVIVFGRNGKLAEFCSGDMDEFLMRYTEYNGTVEKRGPEHFAEDGDPDAGGGRSAPPTWVKRKRSNSAASLATRARLDSRRHSSDTQASAASDGSPHGAHVAPGGVSGMPELPPGYPAASKRRAVSHSLPTVHPETHPLEGLSAAQGNDMYMRVPASDAWGGMMSMGGHSARPMQSGLQRSAPDFLSEPSAAGSDIGRRWSSGLEMDMGMHSIMQGGADQRRFGSLSAFAPNMDQRSTSSLAPRGTPPTALAPQEHATPKSANSMEHAAQDANTHSLALPLGAATSFVPMAPAMNAQLLAPSPVAEGTSPNMMRLSVPPTTPTTQMHTSPMDAALASPLSPMTLPGPQVENVQPVRAAPDAFPTYSMKLDPPVLAHGGRAHVAGDASGRMMATPDPQLLMSGAQHAASLPRPEPHMIFDVHAKSPEVPRLAREGKLDPPLPTHGMLPGHGAPVGIVINPADAPISPTSGPRASFLGS